MHSPPIHPPTTYPSIVHHITAFRQYLTTIYPSAIHLSTHHISGCQCQPTIYLLFIYWDVSTTHSLASIHPVGHSSSIYIQSPSVIHNDSLTHSYFYELQSTHHLPTNHLPPTHLLSLPIPSLSISQCFLSIHPSPSHNSLFIQNPFRCHLPSVHIHHSRRFY